MGLRLLLIDDLHNIHGIGVAPMLVELRELGSAAGVSLGCFATREIAYALRQNDQLANRFDLMTLPRWQIEDPDYCTCCTRWRGGCRAAVAVGVEPDPP